MTAQSVVQNTHWTTLIQRIKERQCIPFLGAAANVSAKGYRGLPLGRDIALRFFEELTGLTSIETADFDAGLLARDLILTLDAVDCSDPKIDALVKSVRPRLDRLADINTKFAPYADLRQLRLLDLSRVALHMRAQNDLPGLLDRLRKLLPDEDRRPSRLLRTLAALPIPLIITTNYDNLMERALGKQPHRVIVQPVEGFKDDEEWAALQEYLATTDERVIYKIHGSFRQPDSDKPGNVIITEEDYIQFLTVVGREVGGIPTQIKAQITEGSLLFLGYSLEDWDFRTIFKGLVESLGQSERRRAFAFQKGPPEFWVQFWEKKDVTIYDVDLYDFAAELENRWKRRNGRGR
jgi:hypothetical protein